MCFDSQQVCWINCLKRLRRGDIDDFSRTTSPRTLRKPSSSSLLFSLALCTRFTHQSHIFVFLHTIWKNYFLIPEYLKRTYSSSRIGCSESFDLRWVTGRRRVSGKGTWKVWFSNWLNGITLDGRLEWGSTCLLGCMVVLGVFFGLERIEK